ncbi:MAG: ATP-binding protein, partial [Lachnospiraceae bacterium]|nr:ATP-binding protein [Lachnospiraceae bacterium]
MKTIQIGRRFEIYDDDLQTHDRLPAQVYTVRFAKMTGFYLEQHTPLAVNEKVYGVHNQKVEKVLGAFENFGRNLGVILSGNKGIGKSIF